MQNKTENKTFLEKFSTFIVEKKIYIFVFFLLLVVGCAILMPKVKINYNITKYLPSQSETRQALDIMDKEFESSGSAKIMVANLKIENAQEIAEILKQVNGVASVSFDNSESHYKNGFALFNVTMKEKNGTALTNNAINEIKTLLKSYDVCYGGDSITSLAGKNTMQNEMLIILLVAVVVIFAVLILTSKSYFEILIFLVVFVVAAILNMGTNYFLGEISFITNSIAVVLQLALAIDYAIILAHRYSEERAKYESKQALIQALKNSIPAILSSSLTTVSGLVALMFMQFRIGFDIGIVLAKGIIFSFLTVFLLMPGIISVSSKLLDKFKHKSFVPSMKFLGKGVVNSAKVVPFVALVLIILAGAFQGYNTYAFSSADYPSSKKTESLRDAQQIEEVFGSSNTIGIILPKGNYDVEEEIIKLVTKKPEVKSVLALTSITLPNNIKITQKLNYKEFAALANVDMASCMQLYKTYAFLNGQSGALAEFETYTIPFHKVFHFLYGIRNSLGLDASTIATIEQVESLLNTIVVNFEGSEHSRIILQTNMKTETKESFEFVKNLRSELAGITKESYLMGDTVSYFDISESFNADVNLVNIFTILFILIILFFTFKSFLLPFILVLVIQGSIWINFIISTIFGTPILFMSYLICSAIHMGATIDYAIVLTNRYLESRKDKNRKEAVFDAISKSFPTIITSSAILTIAGFIIGGISTEPFIYTIGTLLGRGTLISLIMVFIVLPQVLMIADKLIKPVKFNLFKKKFATINNNEVENKPVVTENLKPTAVEVKTSKAKQNNKVDKSTKPNVNENNSNQLLDNENISTNLDTKKMVKSETKNVVKKRKK